MFRRQMNPTRDAATQRNSSQNRGTAASSPSPNTQQPDKGGDIASHILVPLPDGR